jgi:hypothetical protein
MRRDIIDFIGIGVGRSGTTWLATCLNEHPQILMSTQKSAKEVRYFDFQSRFEMGANWYFDQFTPPGAGVIRGEFSPFYYMSAKAAGRIEALLPDIKLLAILRNPVEVVNSYFWYHRGAPWEDINARTLEELYGRGEADNILNLGYYYKHLNRFFERFPREQIHIVTYDEVVANPDQVVRQVFRFLGVRAEVIPASLHVRVNEMSTLLEGSWSQIARYGSIGIMGMLRKAIIANPKLEARLHKVYRRIFSDRRMVSRAGRNFERRWLAELYRPDLLQLQRLIDKDLSAWWREMDGGSGLA